MKRLAVAGAVAIVVVAAGYVLGGRRLGDAAAPAPATPRPAAASTPPLSPSASQTDAPGFLYGRVTTRDGEVYVGRLRWGGGEEAFWGDYFNGLKAVNPWAAQVAPGRLPTEDRSISILGLKVGDPAHPKDLRRRFMARFGDLARIEARGAKRVRVTLKSGTAFDLDRFEAGDFDDGVRVWDARGQVDLDSLRIAAVELLPTPPLGDAPPRLHGTVRTGHGEFTGFLQWDREKGVASDELTGRGAGGVERLPFTSIRTIARGAADGAQVTLRDGRTVTLTGTGDSGVGDVGRDNRGVYVDDARYGRVLVPWEALERADLDVAGSGPAYADFPPGGPLAGAVTAREGRRFEGRLVFDLDETETTETLDAPADGVDYTIPFGLVASIVPAARAAADARATVRLRSGEELALVPSGDLGDANAGVLVFAAEGAAPQYLAWSEVARIDLAPPAATYPPPAAN